jgi:hypothetical protein
VVCVINCNGAPEWNRFNALVNTINLEHSAGVGTWKFKEAISSPVAVGNSIGVTAMVARKLATDLEVVSK